MITGIISDYINRKKVISILQTATIDEVLKSMYFNRIRRIPVIDNDKIIVGIITASDIVRLIQEYGSGEFLKLTVSEVMIKNISTVQMDAQITELLVQLFDNNIRGAPITDDKGFAIGMITERDFLYINELWTEFDNITLDDNLILGEEIDNFILPESFSLWQASDFIRSKNTRDLLVSDVVNGRYYVVGYNDIIKHIYLNLSKIIDSVSYLQYTSVNDITSKQAIQFIIPTTLGDIRKKLNARGASLGIITFPGQYSKVIDEYYLMKMLYLKLQEKFTKEV